MAVGNAPVRVLVDVSPALLAETITRLLRRPDVFICIGPATECENSGPVEITITDRPRLATTGDGLVIRLPAGPRSATDQGTTTDAVPSGVIDLTDLAELVQLVGDVAEGVRPTSWPPPAEA